MWMVWWLVRLPYEESSLKVGSPQEVNVVKGVLDRVEARQETASTFKQKLHTIKVETKPDI